MSFGFPLLTMLVYYMFPYISIGRCNKYVPIYLLVFSMDTYRQMEYNIAMMGEVPEFSGAPRKGGNVVAVSAAQKKATVKYLEKLDEVRIRMPKGRKAIIQAHADAQGQSVNAYINAAIDEKMERDGEDT